MKQILLLAAKMLKLASDEFSNKGCNDIDEEIINTIEDKETLLTEFRNWFEDPPFPINIEQIGDDFLMDFLSHKLNEYANTL